MATVKIIYCGMWGGEGRFKAAKQALENAIAGLNVEGESTPTMTGDFIVIVNG